MWTTASLAALFAELPERAHVVFAAADMAEAQGAVVALKERAEAAEGYEQVKDRLHFQSTPVALDAARARNPLEAAAVGWGGEKPSVTLQWSGNDPVVFHASGSTGWAPIVFREDGEQHAELVVWGSDACSDSAAPSDVRGKAVLVERGTCSFFKKAARAAAAGAVAVLVANEAGKVGTAPMACARPDACEDAALTVPVAMVTAALATKVDSDAPQTYSCKATRLWCKL